MKMTQSAKLFTGLSLMAGLFWGCQDLLSQKEGSPKEPDAIASDASALRLSIKDDSACREQWNVILDARTGGLADTAAEKSFLADCVTEIKPGKGKLPPVIPPHLQPDSISRCRWIVAQIDGGRDEMTVSYKRYCPEDCDTLAAKDSTRHVHLCHEHHNHGVDSTKPPKPVDSCKMARDSITGLDTASVKYKILRDFLLLRCGKPPVDTVKPPKPEDSCRIFRERLAGLDTLTVEYKNLRDYLLMRCGKPPVDTTKPQPVDSCKIYRERLAGLDSNSVEAANLRQKLLERCGKPPIPPVDTTKPRPVDSCKIYRAALAGLDSNSAHAASLRELLLARCGKPPVPNDTLPKPPSDTLPKPIPVKPAPNCDVLRAKLLTLDPASVDSKLLVDAILANCTEAKP